MQYQTRNRPQTSMTNTLGNLITLMEHISARRDLVRSLKSKVKKGAKKFSRMDWWLFGQCLRIEPNGDQCQLLNGNAPFAMLPDESGQ